MRDEEFRDQVMEDLRDPDAGDRLAHAVLGVDVGVWKAGSA